MTKNKLKQLLSPIKIAQIKEINEHPNADKLIITMIDDGSGELTQVVTGATNVSVGDFVPYLGVGGMVPGFKLLQNQEIILKKKPLRGVDSFGMILAEDEIGLSDDHEGIYILNSKLENPESKIGSLLVEELPEVLEVVWKRYQEENALLEGLQSVTTEIIGEEDLKSLLKSGKQINHYIGFEISGLMHIGQGIMTGLVIRELQKLGVHTRVFMANWHTWINNKLDGDWDLILKVAEEYFEPAIKVAAEIAGANSDKIEFINGSELYHNNDKYWQSVIEVSKNLTLSRVLKSTTIMGREASNSMEFAMLIYPSMQAADIFEMQNHIAHAGTDQRNVHMIAREVAEKLTVNPLLNPATSESMKPIAIHHALVSGLNKPAQWPLPENIDKKEMMTSLKMSKSVAGSAILLTDSEEEIRASINKAFCPEKEIGYNPVLNWIQTMIFPIHGKFELKREEKFGGNKIYDLYEELEADYAKGEIFPLDLKNNVADVLVKMLEPARKLFEDKKEIIQIIKDVKKKR